MTQPDERTRRDDNDDDAPPPDAQAATPSAFNTVAFIMLALASLLYVALRAWRLTGSCLWFDEIFSVHAARQDWGGMTAFLVQDLIHPPLFYALLKIWIAAGGESLIWLRLFPAVAAVAAIVPVVLLCRELRLDAAATNLAVALLAVNGYLIKYAQEVRMYSLLLLLTLCSLWLFARFSNAPAPTKKQLALLFAANLLLVYTHYYGWLVVATELVFLMCYGTRQKRAAFSLVAALLVLCFSPWAYAVARAAAANRGLSQNIGWMPRPTPAAIAEFFTTLNEILYFRQSSNEPAFFRLSAVLGALLFGCPVLLLAWRRWRTHRDINSAHANDIRGHANDRNKRDDDISKHDTNVSTRRDEISAQRDNLSKHGDENNMRGGSLRLLVMFFALPVVMAFVASRVLPYSIWGTRHLIIVAAPYLVLVAVALATLRPFWLKTSALLLVVCWTFLMTFVVAIRSDAPYVWCAWDTLARELIAAEPASDAPVKIYAFEDLVAYHTWFSLDTMKQARFRVEVVKGMPGATEDPAYFLPRGFDAVATRDAAHAFAEPHFWVAFRDTSWNPERAPLKFLTDRGYLVGEPAQFNARGNKAFLVPVWRHAR